MTYTKHAWIMDVFNRDAIFMTSGLPRVKIVHSSYANFTSRPTVFRNYKKISTYAYEMQINL